MVQELLKQTKSNSANDNIHGLFSAGGQTEGEAQPNSSITYLHAGKGCGLLCFSSSIYEARTNGPQKCTFIRHQQVVIKYSCAFFFF